MNRDHYQKKFQEHHTKVEPRHALARSAVPVSHYSEYRFQELQMHPIEQKKQNEKL